MKLIVAVDRQGAIGKNGELLVSIPNDQKLFCQETYGKVVIYGRKTLETFPGGRPFEGRENFVLSRNQALQVKGARVAHSLEELFELLKDYDTGDVYVVGGASVYEQLLPFCDMAHVTKIDHVYDADVWFPDLDAAPDWECTADSDEQCYFDLAYYFRKYERKKA